LLVDGKKYISTYDEVPYKLRERNLYQRNTDLLEILEHLTRDLAVPANRWAKLVVPAHPQTMRCFVKPNVLGQQCGGKERQW
jgi:hypothetical protein